MVGAAAGAAVPTAINAPSERGRARFFNACSFLSFENWGARGWGGGGAARAPQSGALPGREEGAIDAARPGRHRFTGDHPGAGILAHPKLVHRGRSVGAHAAIEDRRRMIALLLDVKHPIFGRKRRLARVATRPECSDRKIGKASGREKEG